MEAEWGSALSIVATKSVSNDLKLRMLDKEGDFCLEYFRSGPRLAQTVVISRPV